MSESSAYAFTNGEIEHATEITIKLEDSHGTPTSFWNNLDRRYRGIGLFLTIVK